MMSRGFAEEHKSVCAQGHKVLELVWETPCGLSTGPGSRVWSLFPKYAYPKICSRTKDDDKVPLIIMTLSIVPPTHSLLLLVNVPNFLTIHCISQKSPNSSSTLFYLIIFLPAIQRPKWQDWWRMWINLHTNQSPWSAYLTRCRFGNEKICFIQFIILLDCILSNC